MPDNEIGSLNIAVLQTGRAMAEDRPRHGDYDDMCKALIGRAPDEADTYAVLDGEFPKSIEPYDAFVVTGSAHGAYEDHDWIPPLEALIREAYDKKVKLIGICFGHQIIAQALGGRVEKSDKGFGVGAMDYELVNLGALSQSISLYAWHQDQIVHAPEGAEVIARSDFCPIAGLRYGDRAITFQAHPEFTADYMRALADARRNTTISGALADQAIASLNKPVDAGLIKVILADFLAGKDKGSA
ncbi:MAG: type 1 glutamine amidotransferase [Pseudomonadota bacterium]